MNRGWAAGPSSRSASRTVRRGVTPIGRSGGCSWTGAARRSSPRVDCSSRASSDTAVSRRFPNLVSVRGEPALAYLVQRPGESGYQLRVAPIRFDPDSGSLQAHDVDSRLLAEDCPPTSPVASPDGRWITVVRTGRPALESRTDRDPGGAEPTSRVRIAVSRPALEASAPRTKQRRTIRRREPIFGVGRNGIPSYEIILRDAAEVLMRIISEQLKAVRVPVAASSARSPAEPPTQAGGAGLPKKPRSIPVKRKKCGGPETSRGVSLDSLMASNPPGRHAEGGTPEWSPSSDIIR